jgi:hypothetical protein
VPDGVEKGASGGWTRRRFLKAGGGAVAALAVSGGAVEAMRTIGPWQAAPEFRTFRSDVSLRAPRMVVDAGGDEVAGSSGLLFFTPSGGKHNGLLITDDTGEPIWFRESPKSVANLRVQSYRDAPVLTWWEGDQTAGHGSGEYVILDARYKELRRVAAGHGYAGDLHEFVLTPQGTALLIAYAVTHTTPAGAARPAGLLDGVIQEIDVDSGAVVFEWHSIDHVPVDESHAKPDKDTKVPFDYFHANSVDVTSDGHLLISARNTWTLYKVDRHDGHIIWRLGGNKSDFSLGDGVQFEFQHDARTHDDGLITVFDNGASPKVESESRALLVDVDEQNRTVQLRNEYRHPKHLSAGSQGNVQILPNGNVFVGWGAEPHATEFTADGNIVLDIALPSGRYSYRALRLPWTAAPASVPEAVVRSDGDRRTSVNVSWNGATDVSQWVVLTGASPAQLGVATTIPRAGFDTMIRVDNADPYVAVRAIDSRGTVLGETEPITR